MRELVKKNMIMKSIFLFLCFSFAFLLMSKKAFSAASTGFTDQQCLLGATQACPTIGYVEVEGGSAVYPAQAPMCNCVVTGNTETGKWSSCAYPSGGTFAEYTGSCAAGTRKKKICTFQGQTLSCSSLFVEPKYTCGAWSDASNECPSPVCSVGDKKYQASDCNYDTYTCCTGGFWSGKNQSCPSCGSNQCWNGTICQNMENVSMACSGNVSNASGGNLTRNANCIIGSGWSYGPWRGTCTCKGGYTYNSSSKRCVKNTSGGSSNDGGLIQYTWKLHHQGHYMTSCETYASASDCGACNATASGNVCRIYEPNHINSTNWDYFCEYNCSGSK